MDDVAREAGVSRALVSLVMRGSPKVAEATRRRVQEVAGRLGYSPNRLASRLASKRTGAVGVYLLDVHNPVFADIYDGIAEAVVDAGVQLMVSLGSSTSASTAASERAAIASFADLRVDGILVAGYMGTGRELLASAGETPAVALTRLLDGVDSVAADEVRGGELAVEHLHALGHRGIAHIAVPQGSPYGDRRAGYASAARRLGLRELVVEEEMTEAGGRRAMEMMLGLSETPSAVFANNDLSALGAMSAVRAAGLRVPEDVSVLGYDDTALAASDLVQLSSIDQHSREIGRLGAARLLSRLAGEALPPQGALAPRLIPRASTAPPPPLR